MCRLKDTKDLDKKRKELDSLEKDKGGEERKGRFSEWCPSIVDSFPCFS